MFRNYFKVSVRSLLRSRTYSAINIVGLSVAAACLLLVYLFISDELSFDRFHLNSRSIYRVIDAYVSEDGSVHAGTSVSVPLGPAMVEEFPQVKRSVRFLWVPDAVVARGEAVFKENVRCVDSDFLEMFSFPLTEGDSSTALVNPHSVILSREATARYFGSEEALGRSLSITMSDETSEYIVTGILDDIPGNSTLEFGMLLPLEGHPDYTERSTQWNSKSCLTFVQLHDGADAKAVEKQSSGFLAKHRQGEQTDPDEDYPFFIGLQSLTDIHLNRDSRWQLYGGERMTRIFVLLGIGLLILLMACVNFTTLSIGRFANRVVEIGTRKSLGAPPLQIAQQFVVEAIVLSVIAVLVGLAIAELLLPAFNTLSFKNLTLFSNGIASTMIGMLLLALVFGLLAGGYPAFVMSRFNTAVCLKTRQVVGGRRWLIRSLVTLQFSLAIFLIAATITMSRQITYSVNADLGFDEELLAVIPTYTGWSEEGDRVLSIFRESTNGVPGVISVTGVNYSFCRGYNQIGWPSSGVNRKALSYRVDANYMKTIGAEIVAGRDFSTDMPGDLTGAVIVNEALVREFEIDSPIGQKLDGWPDGTSSPTIIGVVRDYHVASFRRSIRPTVIHINPNEPLFNILVRLSPRDIAATVATLEHTWREAFPDKPFDYSFVDEDVANQYIAERRWESVVKYSSAIAVAIACLGLFGLSALASAQRTKEIGVRKVLGASTPGILFLLSREFIVLVILANVLAWPATYLVMQKWLSSFVYRTAIGLDVFAISGLTALAIALISTCYQAAKAALANPVDSLRYE